MRSPVVLGLDLSLTAPAAVVLGSAWAPGDWVHIPTCLPDTRKLRGEPRLIRIRTVLDIFAVSHGVSHAFVEEYAFTSRNTHLASLGELGGVVKVALYERGIETAPVPAATARKTLLGTIKRSALAGAKVKDYVASQLARMGAPFTSLDIGDAFVVANHGRALLGLSHIGV